MRLRRTCLVATSSATAALLAAAVGTSAQQATRIVDRTVVCRMPAEGYPDATRFMTVSAAPRHRRSGFPPLVAASNGPSLEARAAIQTAAGGPFSTGWVAFNATECTTSELRVPLSARGLREASRKRRIASRCDIPASVVVRVRAEFQRPTGFVRDPAQPWAIVAKGAVAIAYLAVRTAHGEPVAFASVKHASGRARLFISASRCGRA